MSEEKVNMDLLRHELPIQIIDFTSLFCKGVFIINNDGKYNPSLSDVTKDMVWLVSKAGGVPNAHLLG